jgi:hypothetical protein
MSGIVNQIRVFVFGPKPSDKNMVYYQASPPKEKRFGKGARAFKTGDLWIDTTINTRYLTYCWAENGWKILKEVVDTDK